MPVMPLYPKQGHIVSGEGILVDTQKIEAAQNWPRPTSPTYIRSFLRLVGYYRRFVEGFLSISFPLTKLTRKTTKFQWSEACEKTFQALKTRLTTTPMLTLPEGIKGFVVDCDVSRVGLGCVLMQNGKANVFVDALRILFMGNAHIEEDKKELAKEVHILVCLGVRLLGSSNGGVVEMNGAESLLVSELKEKQDKDYILLELKSNVHKKKTEGQVERTIQTLEDMLRAYVMDFKCNWDDHLPLVEFAYNNSYHYSIQMAPYEALYGQRCRSPIGWFEAGEAKLIGPNLVHPAMEKVKIIQERLKMVKSNQKSYTNIIRRDLEFEVDDWVYLKTSPMKGVMRFGKKQKLSPRCIGPYMISKWVGNIAYELELLSELA
ncbi:hypothetical protein MTR67_031369 [Solanum verrucosum]|uniref:Integrase catalytic domain-containing protein n=1 Tax=Solanum verrucosum TaxID=315347 RepID=A0AAF0ZHI3_SOLVR|nr:hypothetical protein MTR67_031369 [Solanum verrucosum]